jgi:hypothetical protein
VWHGLVCVVEAAERGADDAQAGDVRVLDGALEERLQADADAHEGLAGVDVLAEGGDVAGLGELGEAVAEVAYAGEDELL